MTEHALTIRAATPLDTDALARLAELGRRPQLRGPALLAERGGVAIGALALSSGSVAADPLTHTAEAVRLLRLRRYRLMRQGGDVAPVRAVMRRLAPRSS